MFDYELKSMSVDYLKRTHYWEQKNYAVHENIETLIVDTANFLSQIGGNLGLFLGVSCLSVVTGIMQFSKHTMRCWKAKR